MGKVCMTYKLSMRWWLRAYLDCVALISNLTGLEPDWDRVGYWIGRGMKATPCKK